MAGFLNKSLSQFYGDLIQIDNSNNGVDGTVRQAKDGTGDTTPLYMSNDKIKIQPSADSTTNSVIYDASGNALLTVDSTNDLIKAGIGQHSVNTQYATFGFNSVEASMVANTHYCMPFGTSGYSGLLQTIGTGTNPDTALTITASGQRFTECIWYVMDNITIDRVIWWHGADAATGDTTRAHLVSYDVETSAGATSGDLSNGIVLADGADVTNAGHEQAYYQQLTIQSANVNAGKAVFFTFRSDSINSDYTINATVKYHLR